VTSSSPLMYLTSIDDILERLKPSLMKHEGCDVIDINPGPAIWSSKLHQLLKPRKHILMEPEKELYAPFIDPLLNAANSKYVVHQKSGLLWSHLESILTEEHLPHQETLAREDPRSAKPNETLLVLANISYHPRRSYKGFNSISHLVLHQMMSAIRNHSLFHKYGLIRMLVWVEDQERFYSLPRHIHTRKKGSMEAAVSCSHIAEVASSTRPQTSYNRQLNLELESTRKAIQKMEANGVKTPPGRESVYLAHLLGYEAATDRLKKAQADTARFTEELPALEARYAAKEFEKYSSAARSDMEPPIPQKKDPRGRKSNGVLTPEFMRMKALRHLKTTFDKRSTLLDDVMSRQRKLLIRQGEVHNTTGDDAHDERETLMRLRREVNQKIDSLPDIGQVRMAQSYLDTDRFTQVDPPGFLYDRRDAEPLRVKATEFYPQHELALLDFEPQSFWPSIRADPANYDVLEYIITTINLFPTQSTKSALKALWPGAYEWLSAECPSLSDPKRGGDPDLDMIRIRCLTNEHIEEILEAWLRWPFRPTASQLLGRLSYSVYADSEILASDD
jgi:transcription factor 1